MSFIIEYLLGQLIKRGLTPTAAKWIAELILFAAQALFFGYLGYQLDAHFKNIEIGALEIKLKAANDEIESMIKAAKEQQTTAETTAVTKVTEIKQVNAKKQDVLGKFIDGVKNRPEPPPVILPPGEACTIDKMFDATFLDDINHIHAILE
jgi:hypothetical protein